MVSGHLDSDTVTFQAPPQRTLRPNVSSYRSGSIIRGTISPTPIHLMDQWSSHQHPRRGHLTGAVGARLNHKARVKRGTIWRDQRPNVGATLNQRRRHSHPRLRVHHFSTGRSLGQLPSCNSKCSALPPDLLPQLHLARSSYGVGATLSHPPPPDRCGSATTEGLMTIAVGRHRCASLFKTSAPISSPWSPSGSTKRSKSQPFNLTTQKPSHWIKFAHALSLEIFNFNRSP